jgi:2-polyprenyl-3-methyl-5-hydroxy-6-metoxy-1,4-benzoquinol methylase
MKQCQVCNNESTYVDSIDFNTYSGGIFGEPSGSLISYYKCKYCGFAFASEMQNWSDDQFHKLVYNTEYAQIDPDHSYVRPAANAEFLNEIFSTCISEISHLDYGGGNGTMTNILNASGWNSTTYDKFYHNSKLKSEKCFNLITAFEVFEHVPNIPELMDDLLQYLQLDGVILFSTLINDKKITNPLTWWYACPRNGHISLFSTVSLNIIASVYDLEYKKITNNLHIFYKKSNKLVSLISNTSI